MAHKRLDAPRTDCYFKARTSGQRLAVIGFSDGEGCTKPSLNKAITQASHSRSDVLDNGSKRSSVYVTERMSWQSQRKTTRPEALAYSLICIFNVNVPVLCGEGASKAFRRLQEEIIKTSFDHSTFIWRSPFVASGLLVSSPVCFDDLPPLGLCRTDILAPFQMINTNLRSHLMIVSDDPPLIPGIIFGILAYDSKTTYGRGNTLLRLKLLDGVSCYMNDRRCRAFRRVGSTTFDYTPYNTFNVSYEDVVVFEDGQSEQIQTGAQHHNTVW